MPAKKHAHVNIKDCVACGTCEYVCPRGAANVVDGCWAEIEVGLCIGCGMCARACPANCITIVKKADA